MGTNSLTLLTNINLEENKGGKGGKKPQKRDREKDIGVKGNESDQTTF